MKKNYEPKKIEELIYYIWKKKGYFKTKINKEKSNFCIIMPPPNITGNLHMGHALQHTIMDILIRYHRMQGKNTLWQVGLDHAGIATQILVLKKIKLKKNITLKTIGKKKFLNECWLWKEKSQKNINYQMERLGDSIDWSRKRFTLDYEISNKVRKIFIDLYNQGLIYRKKKLSNWDTKLKTVISDLELEYRTIKGYVWYINYSILDNVNINGFQSYVTIATTRPETLLGDTAIAINPLDKRCKDLIGKYVKVPIINRIIPIIADKYADLNKGTGCVKITPAHDFNDYDVAVRHKLPLINIFTYNGNISDKFDIYDVDGNVSNIYDTKIPFKFRGLNRFVVRKKIVDILNKKKLIHKIVHENITVVYGDRSGSKIEPMLTNQWYLKVSNLSKKAISVVNDNKIKFIPRQYKNMYLSWMFKIQDWCISRQLWWGHRIPAWYDESGNVYVGKNENDIKIKYSLCSKKKLVQDEDVLDTWFSSSLWSFIALDWPNKNSFFNFFHPTNVLVSGFDIIFFWIARMIMMTLYFVKDKNGKFNIPFKDVYITGLVRDEKGQKMSKSKGNVLDPLDIIDGISLSELLKKRINNINNKTDKEKIYNKTKLQFPNGIKSFGTDALRFTFSSLSVTTRNINWDMNRLQGYRNFCNKIWHAGRFILLNFKTKYSNIKFNHNFFLFFDHWILIELNLTVFNYRNSLDNYRFDIASNEIYNFFWHKFCNWYLEFSKIIFRFGSSKEVKNTQCILLYVFETILRIAHPIIPFITEKIWIKIKNIIDIKGKTIMLQSFPIYNFSILDNSILNFMTIIQGIIIFLRNTRISLNLNSTSLASLFILNKNHIFKNILLSNYYIIKNLGFLKNIKILSDFKKNISNSIVGIVKNTKFFVVFEKKISFEIELNKLKKKICIIDNKIKMLKKLIFNKKFILKAPEHIIIKKKNFLKVMISTKGKIIQQILKLDSNFKKK